MSTPKKSGRPKLGNITVSIRVSADTMKQVRQASIGNISAWIERAIQTQLALDHGQNVKQMVPPLSPPGR